ncbi:conserved hypothetical protein [Vibrio chagasii]|nr:conserved hypothetical protein [Vibrio chagasii]CAH6965686.1 conserved hypothetical protein [Vibrio chagasii]
MLKAVLVLKLRHINKKWRNGVKGRPIELTEFRQLITKNTPRNDEYALLKVMPLYLASMAGLRELEIALLPTRAFINVSGTLNELVDIHESIAHKGKPRTVIIIPELQRLIEQYIDLLKKSGLNTHPSDTFQGLAPDSVFILSESFDPYKIQSRGNTSRTERLVSQQLNLHMDSLIKNAGLNDVGITRKSLLRRFVIELFLSEISPKDIAYISGLGESSVAQALMMNTGQYDPLFNHFKDRDKRKEQTKKRNMQKRKWLLE